MRWGDHTLGFAEITTQISPEQIKGGELYSDTLVHPPPTVFLGHFEAGLSGGEGIEVPAWYLMTIREVRERTGPGPSITSKSNPSDTLHPATPHLLKFWVDFCISFLLLLLKTIQKVLAESDSSASNLSDAGSLWLLFTVSSRLVGLLPSRDSPVCLPS